MGTVVDDNLPTLNDGRQLLVDFGLRAYRVFVRVRAWSGGEVRLGTPSDTDTEITPRPKVEEVVAGSEYKVSGITPDFGVGGYTLADLNPDQSARNVEVFYIVRERDGTDRECDLFHIDSSGVFGYVLQLRVIERDKPI